MGTFAKREVILLPFPFSDLSARKLRLALVLADAGRGDWLLCQITSNPHADPSAIEIDDNAFASGSLQRVSYARPYKLFTAHESLFRGAVGELVSKHHSVRLDCVPDSVLSFRALAEQRTALETKCPVGSATRTLGA